MSSLPSLRLKKNEDRRLRAGHLWVYSNEVDTQTTSLKNFSPGQEVLIEASDQTILGVAMVNPHSLITARLFTRDRRERLDIDFFIKQFRAALALRESLYAKPFYRFVFGESDFLPGLIIDRFDKTWVLQLNTAGMENKKNEIITALTALFPDTEAILLRNDTPAREQEGLTTEIKTALGDPASHVMLEENNTRFYAPIWEGQKTGWFYDHRLNRTRLKDYVNNRRVLDVFSYLGAWGIQAAVQGASEVYCIDASPLSANAIATHAKLNQVDAKVHTLTDDAFVALKKLKDQQQLFDVIILDPPAFAKKQKDKKEGALAYQRINELALKLLSTNGILISCSCSMHIDASEFLQILRRASLKASCRLQILERGHQAPDHPVHPAIAETDYLKMVIVRKTS